MNKVYPTAIITTQTETHLGDQSVIGDFVLIHCRQFSLGYGSQINAGAKIVGGGDCIVGERSVIGYNAVLLTRSDTPKSDYMSDSMPENRRAIRSGTITIGDQAFVGSNTVIMPGVTVGDGACVGAGSYVDKDVPEWTILIPKQHHLFYQRKK